MITTTRKTATIRDEKSVFIFGSRLEDFRISGAEVDGVNDAGLAASEFIRPIFCGFKHVKGSLYNTFEL